MTRIDDTEKLLVNFLVAQHTPFQNDPAHKWIEAAENPVEKNS